MYIVRFFMDYTVNKLFMRIFRVLIDKTHFQ